MYRQSPIFFILLAKQHYSLKNIVNMVSFVVLRHPVNTLVTACNKPETLTNGLLIFKLIDMVTA